MPGPYRPSSLCVYTGTVARSCEVPVAWLCSRTPPRRSVWMTRPSGSWSKPIGSLVFGGPLIFTRWEVAGAGAPQAPVTGVVVGEHGRAAVAVDGAGDAGRPVDRARELVSDGCFVEAARRVAERGVEGP